MKKKLIYTFTLFFILCNTAYANIDDFLKTGVGARPMALGGSFVAICDEASCVYWNPAGIAQINRMTIEGMYTDQFGAGINHSFLGVVRKPFGFGMVLNSIDGIPVTTGASFDSDGNPIIEELTSFRQNAIYLSYATKVFGENEDQTCLAGASIKSISTSIYTHEELGYGYDAGVLLKERVLRNTKISMGANLVNNISSASGENYSYFNLGIAGTQVLSKISHLTLTASQLFNEGLAYGIEYKWKNLAARMGKGVFDAGNIGASFINKSENTLKLDLTYSAHDFGDSTRISVSYAFGKVLEEKKQNRKRRRKRKLYRRKRRLRLD